MYDEMSSMDESSEQSTSTDQKSKNEEKKVHFKNVTASWDKVNFFEFENISKHLPNFRPLSLF